MYKKIVMTIKFDCAEDTNCVLVTNEGFKGSSEGVSGRESTQFLKNRLPSTELKLVMYLF